ncbi:hypothetical protein WJ99_07415 [Burkholderia ubonensis]|nr:hypothetical protein WJ99_07415 [Burkholderia ubonensis]KVU44790.1 hypothetical protein WK68_07370 [Burkholderia ubonensis]KVU88771.1 hypothetical protein WK76_18650 [Burkholderia ubonensis]KWI34078.1 hypothetical protein WM04_10190 [Burkholderia ubonensis]OJB35004.1 hypothetical protein BGV56_16270 [Burkholderia ubonensis]
MGFEIAGQFVNQVGTFVANRTSEIDRLKQTANDIEQTWGPGKPGRQILTASTAGGNVTISLKGRYFGLVARQGGDNGKNCL